MRRLKKRHNSNNNNNNNNNNSKQKLNLHQTIRLLHSITCRMIQQRLAPLDKLFQMFNQNFGTSEERISKIKKLEKDLLKLSQDFSSMANQPVKHSTLGFTAFDGYTDELFDAIPYLRVERNLGNHFNPNTGEFTAPVDGLYLASLTIEQAGDQAVAASALLISGDVGSCPVHVVTKDKSVHETGTCSNFLLGV
ncbi:uncharacterized protein DDB_G0271850-like [Physella acuta]|uniref:uncharacterized protein DDB_G0271850-like n=1 Tax=Physella acuta TaxID=109671 RepID=UPI0027DB036A|nr:uncharacterized protein DDB_G0271850-like [Physella acuta]